MWEILCQSSPICFLHLFRKMGQSQMFSVCKEVRAPIPSGNDSNLGQSQIERYWRDISLQIHSGMAIKLRQYQILRFCRELTYWSPIGRETNFGSLLKCKKRRVVSPCHSISSQSLDKSTSSEFQTFRFWSAVRYRMPWGRGHLSKLLPCSLYSSNLIWREGQ